MPAWFRLLFYACLGVTAEVVFTAVGAKAGLGVTPGMKDPRARASRRLEGHSFLWMLPAYGFGFLFAFEPLHDALRGTPWPLRGLAYTAGLFVLEFAYGALTTRLAGEHVWCWTGPGSIRGHIMLSMAPVWFGVGLALEPLHDLLVRG